MSRINQKCTWPTRRGAENVNSFWYGANLRKFQQWVFFFSFPTQERTLDDQYIWLPSIKKVFVCFPDLKFSLMKDSACMHGLPHLNALTINVRASAKTTIFKHALVLISVSAFQLLYQLIANATRWLKNVLTTISGMTTWICPLGAPASIRQSIQSVCKFLVKLSSFIS